MFHLDTIASDLLSGQHPLAAGESRHIRNAERREGAPGWFEFGDLPFGADHAASGLPLPAGYLLRRLRLSPVRQSRGTTSRRQQHCETTSRLCCGKDPVWPTLTAAKLPASLASRRARASCRRRRHLSLRDKFSAACPTPPSVRSSPSTTLLPPLSLSLAVLSSRRHHEQQRR